jgi:hypothetical protein
MMADDLPPPLTPEQAEALKRQRRGRNWAMLIALLALSALFYAISIVKLAHPG